MSEVKLGSVIFFRKGKMSTKKSAREFQFQGHAFGVLLGHVPPFQKEPPQEHMFRLMGTIGFLTFDDVAEFCGDEMGAKAIKKFEEKYYGQFTVAEGKVDENGNVVPALPDDPGLPVIAREPQKPRLLNAAGLPYPGAPETPGDV